MLLVNHGIVTAGKDVRDAVIRAVLLEKAAHQQVLTYTLGEPRHWSSDEEALAKRGTYGPSITSSCSGTTSAGRCRRDPTPSAADRVERDMRADRPTRRFDPRIGRALQ